MYYIIIVLAVHVLRIIACEDLLSILSDYALLSAGVFYSSEGYRRYMS